MTYRIIPLIGMIGLCMPTLIPTDSVISAEIYRQWERSRRRRQIYTPPSTNHQYNEPGVQEVHGAVKERDCYKMAKNFRQQGRNVTLVRVERSTNPGATLRYNCIFEGKDAQTGWYDEKRY